MAEPENLATLLCCDTQKGPRISNDTTTLLCFNGVEKFYDVSNVWTRTWEDIYFFDVLEHNEDFEATWEAQHFLTPWKTPALPQPTMVYSLML
jgi:hypothetical protein